MSGQELRYDGRRPVAPPTCADRSMTSSARRTTHAARRGCVRLHGRAEDHTVPPQEWAQTSYKVELDSADIVRVQSAEQTLVLRPWGYRWPPAGRGADPQALAPDCWSPVRDCPRKRWPAGSKCWSGLRDGGGPHASDDRRKSRRGPPRWTALPPGPPDTHDRHRRKGCGRCQPYHPRPGHRVGLAM